MTLLKRTDDDFRDEIEAHVALEADRLIAEGVRPAEARDLALRRFGNVTAVRERFYESRRIMWFDELRQDVRYAPRTFARSPLFALTATLSLAVGIGATTTIFAVANTLLLRAPAGVTDAGTLVDLVRIDHDRSGPAGVRPGSYPDYLDLRERLTGVSDLYAYHLDLDAVSLTGADGSERVFANIVSMNYFEVLGVRAAAGRMFAASDSEQPGASPMVVLSHRFWVRRFNADPAIIGRTLPLNGTSFAVIGLADPAFRGSSVVAPDVWAPVSMIAAIRPLGGEDILTSRSAGWLMLGGRLKADVPIARASAELDAVTQALQQQLPAGSPPAGWQLAATTPVPAGLRLILAGFLTLLMAVVSLVLVMACVNLAGVLLARGTVRRREIAVRLAVGAGRTRLIRQLLTETVLLFLVGAAAGLWLTRGMIALLLLALPAFPLPVDLSFPIDLRVVLFTAGLALVAAVLSGLAPALQASRANVVGALKDESLWPSERLRLRNAFVIAQVAVSMLLVVAGGLLVRALDRVGTVDRGFDPRGIEVASLDLSLAGYTDRAGMAFADELLARVRALPAVAAATIADRPPLRGQTVFGGLSAPGTPGAETLFHDADWNVIGPDYFGTLGLSIVAGRDFADSDTAAAAPIAIVSESLARRFWPGEHAIGRQLRWQFGIDRMRGGARAHLLFPAPEPKMLTIVGVVRDVRDGSGGLTPSIYLPLQQRYQSRLVLLARVADGRRLAGELRPLITSMNPTLPLLETHSLEEDHTGPVLTQLRIAASVAGSVGMIGLLLAATGIYGVTAYAVSRRTREIGIRVAMGARRGDVIRMVLRQGMTLVLIGSAFGLILAAGASRVLVRLLHGLPPLDPLTFSSAAVLFVLTGLLACYLPVRRATRVDPVAALRYE